MLTNWNFRQDRGYIWSFMCLFFKCLGNKFVAQPKPLAISEAGTIDPIPAEILEHRWVKQGKKIIHEVLIRWENLPTDDATWEDSQLLHQRFLTLRTRSILKGVGMIRVSHRLGPWGEHVGPVLSMGSSV